MNPRFSVKRWFSWLCAGIFGLVLGFIAWKSRTPKLLLNDATLVASCANHAIQLGTHLFCFEEDPANVRYPTGVDARSALMAMGTNSHPLDWFRKYGSACPEPFLRDQSIGYVYFGDDLPTRSQIHPKPLILMCPAGSHQNSEQHCHALRADAPVECLESNTRAIALLEFEIDRAAQRLIPYSSNAVALMTRELALRRGHEKGRSNSIVLPYPR